MQQSHPPSSKASSSQVNSTKGKLTCQLVADIKAGVNRIDDVSQGQMSFTNECYNIKMQVKLCDKEITYLKSEKESKCTEAEKIYQHWLEHKKVKLQIHQADTVAFDKEKSTLEVKLQIVLAEVEQAKLVAGVGPSSIGVGSSSSTGVLAAPDDA